MNKRDFLTFAITAAGAVALLPIAQASAAPIAADPAAAPGDLPAEDATEAQYWRRRRRYWRRRHYRRRWRRW